MKSALPKVLHEVGGRPMLDWAIAAASAVNTQRTIVVAGAHSPTVGEHVSAALGPGAIAIQDPPLGTAHAVRAAERALADFEGDVVILYGDAPFVLARRIDEMFALRASQGGIAILGFNAQEPSGYGRLLQADDGTIARIVEEKDANERERALKLCNSGVYCADARVLFRLLAMVKNDNAKREYYLTDIVELGRAAGFATHLVVGEEDETRGVNSKSDLAAAEAAFQRRKRAEMMDAGVTLIDPETVYFSHDTAIAADAVIEPNVFFGKGVKIGAGARIKAFCHFEGATIADGAEVGPFARLRKGANLGQGVKIGNFVEIKNANFGPKAKASHLSYIGDADIGAKANLGAGTITCNYDGFDKYRTTIGEEAFIGSDTSLVAPVKVGARAYTGSGSVITKDVPDGALAVARGRQRDIEGWADAFRAKKRKAKETK